MLQAVAVTCNSVCEHDKDGRKQSCISEHCLLHSAGVLFINCRVKRSVSVGMRTVPDHGRPNIDSGTEELLLWVGSRVGVLFGEFPTVLLVDDSFPATHTKGELSPFADIDYLVNIGLLQESNARLEKTTAELQEEKLRLDALLVRQYNLLQVLGGQTSNGHKMKDGDGANGVIKDRNSLDSSIGSREGLTLGTLAGSRNGGGCL